MTDLTPAVARLLELAEKATPGPWSSDGQYVYGLVPEGRPGGEVIAEARATRSSLRDMVPHQANAEFLVAAVNSVVPLARDWERLREALNHYGRLDSFPPYVGGDDDEIEEWQATCDCGFRGRRWNYVTPAHMELIEHMNKALLAALDLKEEPAK